MKDSESHLSRLQDSLHEDSEDPAQRCRLVAELPYNRTRRKLKEA